MDAGAEAVPQPPGDAGDVAYCDPLMLEDEGHIEEAGSPGVVAADGDGSAVVVVIILAWALQTYWRQIVAWFHHKPPAAPQPEAQPRSANGRAKFIERQQEAVNKAAAELLEKKRAAEAAAAEEAAKATRLDPSHFQDLRSQGDALVGARRERMTRQEHAAGRLAALEARQSAVDSAAEEYSKAVQAVETAKAMALEARRTAQEGEAAAAVVRKSELAAARLAALLDQQASVDRAGAEYATALRVAEEEAESFQDLSSAPVAPAAAAPAVPACGRKSSLVAAPSAPAPVPAAPVLKPSELIEARR